jgi:hypothetical protein
MTTTHGEETQALFALGQVVVTTTLWTTLLEEMSEAEALRQVALILERHRHGDFGDVGEEDWEANLSAIGDGTRVFSSYPLGPVTSWCITEADRSVTTVLMPEDY